MRPSSLGVLLALSLFAAPLAQSEEAGLPVATAQVSQAPSYAMRQQFAGLVESAQQSTLAFTTSAGKPRRGPLRRVIEQLDLPHGQVAIVGDRVFTDVLAGNRLGLFTVLVHPIGASGQASRHDRLQRSERTLARWCGARVDSALPQ